MIDRIIPVLSMFFFGTFFTFGQTQSFRECLSLDTIIYHKPGYRLSQETYAVDFNVHGNKIYMITVNHNNRDSFQLCAYDKQTYKEEQKINLVNTFKDDGILGFDLYKNKVAVLSFSGWLLYSLENNRSGLIGKSFVPPSRHPVNAFTEIKIINDSVLGLARAFSFSGLKKEEAPAVVYYDFVHSKELKRFNIDFGIPEFSLLEPNGHVVFYGDKCYVSDFTSNRTVTVSLIADKPTTIIDDTTGTSSTVKVDEMKLKKARLQSKSKFDVSSLLDLLTPYFTDSAFVLADIRVINDSMILTRCIKPQKPADVFLNNYIELWKRNPASGKYDHFKSFPDLTPTKEEMNRDSIYTKTTYRTWTGVYKYKIVENKIYFILRTSPVYPIGLSRRDFHQKETLYLSEHSSVPAIVVYDIEDTIYKP